MKTTPDRPRQQTWLGALAEAAQHQRVSLPPFTEYGMGALRSAVIASGRFVTLKRLVGRAANAEVDGVEWALWHEPDDFPVVVAAFREPPEPNQESVVVTLSFLKGWLVDQWTADEAKKAVSKHPRAQPIKDPPPRSSEVNSRTA